MGSIENLYINLRETYKKQKFTPLSPIKATPTIAESNSTDDCLTSLSDDDDKKVTSSTKSKEILVTNSTPENNNPSEGETTAIVAVMRGKPKEGYYHHRSNKHNKKRIVRVLLDSDSDGDLVFVDKDNTMLLPYSKRLFLLQLNSNIQHIRN